METPKTEPPKLHETRVLALLQNHRWRKNLCVPRYTPAKWWECDLFELTPAGYFREYEVKLTRADFFADAKKGGYDHSIKIPRDDGWGFNPATVKKHDLLTAGSTRGPVQFWFVTPAGILNLLDIPPWAGWIEIVLRNPGSNYSYFVENELKAAPRLHKNKFDPRSVDHARRTMYYRYHELRIATAKND